MLKLNRLCQKLWQVASEPHIPCDRVEGADRRFAAPPHSDNMAGLTLRGDALDVVFRDFAAGAGDRFDILDCASLRRNSMHRVAVSLVAIALICTASSSAWSRGRDPLSKEDVERRAKYKEVYRFNVRGLIEATLTKSKDLAKKGRNTYFCTYDSAAQPRACDRMDTVSGQYEDYYQSQMACKERCPRADISQSSWTYMAGKRRICKDLATGSCDKAALTVDQMREELIDLLEIEQEMSPRPGSSASNPGQRSNADNQ